MTNRTEFIGLSPWCDSFGDRYVDTDMEVEGRIFSGSSGPLTLVAAFAPGATFDVHYNRLLHLFDSFGRRQSHSGPNDAGRELLPGRSYYLSPQSIGGQGFSPRSESSASGRHEGTRSLTGPDKDRVIGLSRRWAREREQHIAAAARLREDDLRRTVARFIAEVSDAQFRIVERLLLERGVPLSDLFASLSFEEATRLLVELGRADLVWVSAGTLRARPSIALIEQALAE